MLCRESEGKEGTGQPCIQAMPQGLLAVWKPKDKQELAFRIQEKPTWWRCVESPGGEMTPN